MTQPERAWLIRRLAGAAVSLSLVGLLAGLAVIAAQGDPSAVPVVVWVLVVPAYARAVQLAANDRITEPARNWAARRAGFIPETSELTALAYLAGCPWCLSIYVAAGLSAVILAAPTALAAFVVLTLAGSEIAVVFDRLVDLVVPDPVDLDERTQAGEPPAAVSALFQAPQREDRI